MSGLVAPDEPLVLADGTKVYRDRVEHPPSTEEQSATPIEIPNAREAQELIVHTRRKLGDLPELPKTMNAISVIVAYTLFGLDNTDIAIATGLSQKQIENVRNMPTYQTMHNDIVTTILETETNSVRDIFTAHARKAANVFVGHLSAKNPGLQIKAATEILDRGGHRPVDIVEHRHKVEGGLTIEIVRKGNNALPPTIDMDV